MIGKNGIHRVYPLDNIWLQAALQEYLNMLYFSRLIHYEYNGSKCVSEVD